ncbi:SAM-dependent methyltransferase [Yinghuangia soli]|uniref:SAM-dependent methyltransferase n=1 Tax=Yinghuangia soli TaxID=2908204 RepID=A0AA41U5I7_9ACTN|nr:SAM-dependent methyltransferase [Yinghuangia soli]MCF2531977.1 SAM-dependent methyltransferase [Yinghuangia soli]
MTQRGPEPWRLPRGDEVETQVPQGIDTSIAHPARMYDYFLGGKNNFAADRAAAELILQAVPETRYVARINRDFLVRAVRTVTAEYGIRQFLDLGTGIPADGNIHEVAQAVAPETRVAYVDNDPIVLAHARALVSGDPRGRTTFFQADLRDPEKILAAPEVRDVIDFDQPVAVVMAMVLHFVRDAEDPAGIVARLRAGLAPGSMLILTHASFKTEALKRYAEEVYDRASAPVVPRSADEIAPLLAGFDPIEPGLVRAPLWRPDPGTPEPTPQELEEAVVYTAVAVKT